jgi:hypothetical protein
MSASYGNLELCRFLLRQTALFHEQSVLRSAFHKSFNFGYDSSSTSQQGTQPFVERICDLYIDECGLEIDLKNHTILSASQDFGYRHDQQWNHTESSFNTILASQPIRFLEMPFAERLNIAVNSTGWPADSFWIQLYESGTHNLATESNGHGRTAFHWAAAHFGEWLRRSGPFKIDSQFGMHCRERASSYAKLASRLVRMGADLHAVCYGESKGRPNTRALLGMDPFFAFLAGSQSEFANSWFKWSISHAISRWGKMLADRGVHLPDYVVAENKFLEAIQCIDLHAHLSRPDDRMWQCVPVKLHVSTESTLTADVVDIPRVPIWKKKVAHVPGAWLAAPTTLDTIIWAPDSMDEQDGFVWSEIGVVNLRLNRIEPRALVPPDHFHLDWQPPFISQLQGIQDDHGSVANISRRDWSARQHRDHKPGHSRASSTPPSIRILKDGPFRIWEDTRVSSKQAISRTLFVWTLINERTGPQ